MELIKVFDNVLDNSMCNHIITLFNNNNNNNCIGMTSGGYAPKLKLTTDFDISRCDSNDWKDIDKIIDSIIKQNLHKYTEYIYSLNNYYSLPNKELQDNGFLMQKYEKNKGFFNYHQDFSSIYENKSIYYRVLVYILYLNDIDEGGETIIWDDYKIKPKAGSLLFFPSTWTYPHKGNMPISHDKYIITGWLYAKY